MKDVQRENALLQNVSEVGSREVVEDWERGGKGGGGGGEGGSELVSSLFFATLSLPRSPSWRKRNLTLKTAHIQTGSSVSLAATFEPADLGKSKRTRRFYASSRFKNRPTNRTNVKTARENKASEGKRTAVGVKQGKARKDENYQKLETCAS